MSDLPLTLVLLAVSFVLAGLTYLFIEKPIRSSPVRSRRLGLVVAALGVILVVGAVAARDRMPPRLHGAEVGQVIAAAHDWSYPFGANFGRVDSFERSTVAGRGGPAVLFIGDSQLEQYWPRLEVLVHRRAARDLWFATNGGCPPLRGVGAPDQETRCSHFLDFAIAEARKPEVGTVVFGAAWPAYPGTADRGAMPRALGEFASTIGDLVGRGKRVYVILSSPISPSFSPRNMISRLHGTVSYPPPVPASRNRTVDEAIRAAATGAGANVIDPLPSVCPGGFCPAVTSERIPIYKDGVHLRPFYVREHALFLDSIVQ